MKNNNIKEINTYVHYYNKNDTLSFLGAISKYNQDKPNELLFVSYFTKESSYIYFNSENSIYKRIDYSDNKKFISNTKYDDKGRKKIKIDKVDKGRKILTKYKYISGNKVESITYDYSDKPFMIDTLTYNKKGKIKTVISYGRDNTFETELNYFYNSKGQLIKIESKKDRIKFAYNSSNLRISESWFNKNSNELFYKFIYKYYFIELKN